MVGLSNESRGVKRDTVPLAQRWKKANNVLMIISTFFKKNKCDNLNFVSA